MDSIVCYGVQPLPLPSAIHCLTATMPALTVTLSANGDGSGLGASGVVGRVFGLGGVGLVIPSSQTLPSWNVVLNLSHRHPARYIISSTGYHFTKLRPWPLNLTSLN